MTRPLSPPATPRVNLRWLTGGVVVFLVGVFAVSSAGVLLITDHQLAATTQDSYACFQLEMALLAGGAIALVTGALWLSYASKSP